MFNCHHAPHSPDQAHNQTAVLLVTLWAFFKMFSYEIFIMVRGNQNEVGSSFNPFMPYSPSKSQTKPTNKVKDKKTQNSHYIKKKEQKKFKKH